MCLERVRSDRNESGELAPVFLFSATGLPPRTNVPTTNDGVRIPVASAGRIFSDGSFMELTCDRSGALKFLTRDGYTAKIVDQFTHGDVEYTTPLVHHSIRDSLMLPNGFGEVGSTRQLIKAIDNL